MIKPLKALIVDDSEEDALMVVLELQRGGYDPTFERVDNREAMQAALDRQNWDVVLVDYLMPRFSGLEALQLFQDRQIDIPFIMVSGKIGEDAAVNAMRAGAHDFVIKGNLARLVPAMERELRDAAVRRGRSEMESALQESESRYTTILESIEDGYYEMDPGGSITHCNNQLARITGYPPERLLGLNFRSYMDAERARDAFAVFHEVFLTGKPVRGWELELLRPDGERVFLEISISVVRDSDGTPVGFRGIAREITERKRAEETIRQLAYQDVLTGLPNRRLFQDRFQQAMAYASRTSQPFAIMLLDLDRFKYINDTLGHQMGDSLLISVAERLTNMLRKGDTIARMGGDEFLLLVPELVNGRQDTIQIAEKIITTFREPFTIRSHELQVTASIGIALYPEDGDDIDILMKQADIAMYQSKEQGRNRYFHYSQAMLSKTRKP